MPSPLPMVTPRLRLRAFTPADADDLYAYLSEQSVYRFEPGEPISPEQAGKMAQDLSTSPAFWAVALQDTSRVIGQISFQQIDPPHLLTWELGYILSPYYQRQGYMSEAVTALLWHQFAAGEIHRIVAHCNPENTASWKLLERVGFRREGLFRQNVFFRRNALGEPLWTDTYVYAMLKSEAPDKIRNVIGAAPGTGVSASWQAA